VTASDPLIGTELGDFRIVARLGQGGMGAVYEAEDLALHRYVALKVLLPEFADDSRARARFQREIDHAVAIEHPHVVPVYAAGFERPHFYISMRLVRGPDLHKTVREDGALEESRALRILGQVASALHAVHAKGLVHRDVKPHNVLLWEAGSDEEHAMLTDFGIAKALDDTHSLTGLAAIGTPGYMAPEISLGHLATPACDQYSLGCMAYELLAGRPPFDGDADALRRAHVEERPVPLANAAPHISRVVAAAVDTALAKNPMKRHSDVRAFVKTAQASDDAFRRSQAITRVMTEARKPEEAVGPLSAEHGLSDTTISQLTDLDRTEVVRLRRRQARHALVGRRPS
jgi:serine/threonine protein kinase